MLERKKTRTKDNSKMKDEILWIRILKRNENSAKEEKMPQSKYERIFLIPKNITEW